MKTFRILSVVTILALIALGCAQIDLGFNPSEVATQISQAGTKAAWVVTESAPLRATSAKLMSTVITGGKTELPPVMTQAARALTLVAVQANKTGTTVFAEPHANYAVVDNCLYSSYHCAKNAPHTGVDSVANPNDPDGLPVEIVAVGAGRVARIVYTRAGCSAEGGDCGMGNTVILEHTLADGTLLYSLYAHLDSIAYDIAEGQCLQKGDPLGKMGASGFGQRDYWQKPHLHFEFKTAPVIGDPRSALSSPQTSPEGVFFGYINAPADPDPGHWGYFDPAAVIDTVLVRECP